MKIGKHLFDSISAKERVVCIKIFNGSILISNNRVFEEQIMSVALNNFSIWQILFTNSGV